MSSLYEQLIQPIEHCGASEPVTATDLRRCLSKVADAIESSIVTPVFSPPSEPEPSFDEVSASGIGDDGPFPEPESEKSESSPEPKNRRKKAKI